MPGRSLVMFAMVFAALAWASAALAGTQSYTTSGTYTFTVPAGVTSVGVVAVAGSGGTGTLGAAGGLGAQVEGTITVEPGATLQINVGGQGGNGVFGDEGGGGGGGSDVRTDAFTLTDRIIVAGGGGGGGGDSAGASAGSGGDGGGNTGGGGDCGSGAGGGGGTQSNGGAGGSGPSVDGSAGSFGQGGSGRLGGGGSAGVNGGGEGGDGRGGGGGGGWYGGGGGGSCGAVEGTGGGGGGGSNHAAAGVTGFSEGLAASAGDGSVTLTWTDIPVAVINPASHDFGEVLVDAGPWVAQAFTVTNEGGADLMISTVTLTGADAGEFVLANDGCGGQTLAPTGFCQVEVAYDPSSTGVKDALIEVTDNAAGSPHTAALTGIGVIETPAPVLNSLSPTSGRAGTVVTILGEGFTDATDVLFGDVEASFTVVSDTQLQATAPVQPVAFGKAARAPQGLALTVPVVVVGPGGASNALGFTYTGAGGVSVPGACNPLYRACAGGPTQAGTSPLAPSPGGDNGTAVGHARMPNLRAAVTATWANGTIRITVRVLISKARLVSRWFYVRVRIPSLDETKLVRVSAQGRRVRTLHLAFTGPASTIGKRVIVRVDTTDRILETRKKDNTASARIL